MKNWHDRDQVTRRLRLRNYDYATPGIYFVTICTEQRGCLFGEVVNDVMAQSPAGVVVESWWHFIPQRFPSMVMDDVVIMPNHLHGIIMTGFGPPSSESESLPSLSTIIPWFKGMTTKDYIMGVKTEDWPRFPGRLWQQGFHEHIIRSDRALEQLRAYIVSNPSQWTQDENNLNRANL